MRGPAPARRALGLAILVTALFAAPVVPILHGTVPSAAPRPLSGPPGAAIVLGEGRQLLGAAARSLSAGEGPAFRVPWSCPGVGLRLVPIGCGPQSPHPPRFAAPPRASTGWTHLGTFGGRVAGGIAYDPVDGYVVMFGGVPDDGSTWTFSGGNWTNRTATVGPAPPPRVGAAMTYDSADGYILLYGGAPPFGGRFLNDTWSFLGGKWTNRTGTVGPAPSPRIYTGLAYDATAQKVVAFGGQTLRTNLNDTWEFSGGHWTNVTSNQTSAPRGSFTPTLAYDPADGYIVLAGGMVGASALSELNTTWTFSSGHWKNITSMAGPAPAGRAYATMFSGAGSTGAYLFGGFSSWPPGSSSYEQLNDLWKFSGGAWTRVATGGAGPAPRILTRLVADPHDNLTLLYGGDDLLNSSFLGDTWALSNGSWSLVAPSSTPAPRVQSGMAYDPTLPGTVLFGGSGLNDTWSFSGGSWTLLHPAVSPSGRLGASLAYDAADSEVVLFGGFHLVPRPSFLGGNDVYLNDTWTWAGGSWRNITDPAHAPSARASTQLTYDSADQRIVLFGGLQGYQDLADTWTFHAGVWANVTRQSTFFPPPRAGGAFSDDPGDSGALLVGGQGLTLWNDTWVYHGGNWTRGTTAGAPPGVYGGAAAYDSASASVLLFGGEGQHCVTTTTGTNCLSFSSNETWSYALGRWTNLTSSLLSAPSGRADANLVYDPTDRVLFLYGGQSPGGYPGLGEWWSLAGGAPAPLTASAPAATVNPVVVGNGTALSVMVQGGSLSYTLTWVGLPAGCSSQNWTPIICVPTSAGTFSVSVRANDSGGASTTSSALTLSVLGASQVLGYVKLLPASPWVDVGSTLRVDAAAFDLAGHQIPSANFSWSRSPAAKGSLNASTGGTVVLTGGPLAGPLTIFLNGTFDGTTRGNSTRVAIEPAGTAPLTISGFAASPPQVPAGTSFILSAGVAGGQPPYAFAYHGLPPGCVSPDSNTTICTPIVRPVAPTTYAVTLTVTDVNGAPATAETNVTVLPAPPTVTSAAPVTLPGWLPWLLVGAVGVAVIGAGLWFRSRRSKLPPPEKPWD